MAIQDPKFTERALEQDALRVLEKEAAGFGHTALPKDKFLKGNENEHRGLHYTLYYNPEDGTLNIFYNALDLEKSEEITVIINKEKIVKIITKPGFWTTRILDLFNEITHVRVDNNNKVIYEVSFDNEFREIFKNKSYILNNEK